jgi:ribosomal protein S18 acetylase RimI-like enzyme
MVLIIRNAKKRDSLTVIKLMREYDLYENKLDKSVEITSGNEIKITFLSDLESSRAYYVLAQIDKEILGMIIWSVYQSGKIKWGVIQDLIVNKNFRNSGIGSELFNYVYDRIKNKGCKKIKSFVRFNNTISLKFWKKKGFKSTENKGYSIIKEIK